ncbi:MFS general substrate transporter [Cadophora sp. DSE1049]|nr:MFS general substrate transporter [Cadophora sp. DSE1049]
MPIRPREHLATRLPTLKPQLNPTPNPFTLLRELSLYQWLFFLPSEISVAVTLVLMFRPLGAAIFGFLSDRYGRKWPFVVNCILLIIFELATGSCNTYRQFLAVRAMFGIAMGAIYGNDAATALEDCPEEARGLMSGVYQSGCPFGYLLATVFWKAFHDKTPHGWRPLFCFGAGPPVLLMIFRMCLPEMDAYNKRHNSRNEKGTARGAVAEVKIAVRMYWQRLIYLLLFMAGFNYVSHGTQDIVALMLKNKYDFSATKTTRVVVVLNLARYQIFGRRLSIIVVCILGGSLLYPYTSTSGPGIYAAVFFMQFFLSPPAFRTFVVGTSYQLGNLISAASNTIETTIGERYPLPDKIENGEVVHVYDYSVVMRIFTACVFVYVIFITFLGPEELGKSMIEDDEDESSDEGDNNGLQSQDRLESGSWA